MGVPPDGLLGKEEEAQSSSGAAETPQLSMCACVHTYISLLVQTNGHTFTCTWEGWIGILT